MTPEQKNEFYKHGCVSRCIIQLTEWHKKPITAVAFVERFQPIYPQWSRFFGLLSPSDVVDICRELKIGRHASSYRDSNVVEDCFKQNKTSGVFMFSERDLTGGSAYHCSLIGYENGRFRFWSPSTNGMALDCHFDKAELDATADKLLAHFLILRCTR